MKLIIIYGPPASGKLTVAKELSKITGFKLFHNHLTVDLIESVIKFGTKTFFELSSKFRMEIFEAVAKENIDDLIFTLCYAYPEDNKFIKETKKKVEKYKGEVLFVQLNCQKQELYNRVIKKSRHEFGKLKTTKGLDECLAKWNLFTPIPFVKNLVIDNTNLSAKSVALKIKEFYKL